MAKSTHLYSPLHADAPDHPKVYALAAALGIPDPYAFGLLACLWARSLTGAKDGCIKGGPRHLARLTSWTGDADELAAAMVQVGVLDDSPNGLLIHDWHLYGGRAIKVRSALQERFKGRGGARERASSASAAATAAAPATAVAAASAVPSAAAVASDLISLSSDLDLKKPERRIEVVARAPARDRPPNVHRLVELEHAAKDPDELLAMVREAHATEWGRIDALDGQNGRLMPIEVLRNTFENYRNNVARWGLRTALDRAWGFLMHDAQKAHRDYQRDRERGLVASPASASGISETQRTRYALARRNGVDLPPIEEWVRKQDELKPVPERPPDEGPAPDVAALVREAAERLRKSGGAMADGES
jgi:hypothetical protein